MHPRGRGSVAAVTPVRATHPPAAVSSVARASSSRPSRPSPSPSPLSALGRSPSPSDIAAQDRHADVGSDLDYDDDADDTAGVDGSAGEDDDDDAASVGVVDDADVVDAHGRVLNDGDELLDVLPPPSAASALPARLTSSAAATAVPSPSSSSDMGELLQSLHASFNADGSPCIYLCPSMYGRPATVYFEYPLAFGMQRPQEKILCARICHLRYKHADDACIYNSITGSLKRAGFTEQEGTSARDRCAWNVRWGKHMLADAFKELRSYQRINHFPGTGGIGRKDRLARNIARSRRRLGGDKYNFLPETYLLPADRGLWESKFGAEPPGTLWIAKPNSSSCGRGIRLVSKITDLAPNKACIVSRYIANPLLVNERKFDLRIYVLCTSFNPLKIYVYTNGLARFCTSKYDVSKKNLRKKYIHLTNFSVNKRSANFVANQAGDGVSAAPGGSDASAGGGEGDSSKWSLRAFKRYLEAQYGAARCATVWAAVSDIFIKTLLSVESNVTSNVSRLAGGRRDVAFELYGFDILLDANLKPWLMEVNCAPSLSSSSPLDKRIKNELLTDTFHTIGIKPAYVKDKDSSRNKERKGGPAPASKKKGGSGRSAREDEDEDGDEDDADAAAPHSSAFNAGQNVVRGGTMGPSNSRNSRASSAGPHSSPSSSPTSAAAAAAVAAAASNPDSGNGRIARLRAAVAGGAGVLAQYFSSLSKADLSVLREYRDELSRGVSGSWRPIFPLGASPLAGSSDPNDAPSLPGSSLDLYGDLFEFAKYDSLLLMVFTKHFGAEAQHRICVALQPVPARDVVGMPMPGGHAAAGATPSDGTNSNTPASPSAAAARRASGHGSPLSPKQQQQVRPFSGSSVAAAGAGSNGLVGHAGQPAVPAVSVGSGVAHHRVERERAPFAAARNAASSAGVAGQRVVNSTFLAPASTLPTTPSTLAASSVAAHLLLSSLSSSEEEEEAILEIPRSRSRPSSSRSTAAAPAVAAVTDSPLHSSPEDSETDERGRPRRRYFDTNGVSLQPYIHQAPQYHEGWTPGSTPRGKEALDGDGGSLAAAANAVGSLAPRSNSVSVLASNLSRIKISSRPSSAAAAAAAAAQAHPYAASLSPPASLSSSPTSSPPRARSSSAAATSPSNTRIASLRHQQQLQQQQLSAWETSQPLAPASSRSLLYSGGGTGGASVGHTFHRPASTNVSLSASPGARLSQPLRPSVQAHSHPHAHHARFGSSEDSMGASNQQQQQQQQHTHYAATPSSSGPVLAHVPRHVIEFQGPALGSSLRRATASASPSPSHGQRYAFGSAASAAASAAAAAAATGGSPSPPFRIHPNAPPPSQGYFGGVAYATPPSFPMHVHSHAHTAAADALFGGGHGQAKRNSLRGRPGW